MKKILDDEKLYKIFILSVVSGILIVLFYFLFANLTTIFETVRSFFNIIASFVWGIFFALITYKAACRIEEMIPGTVKPKTRRFIASLVAILALVLIIVSFFLLLIPQIASSIVQIGSLIQNFSASASKTIEVLVDKYNFSSDIASTLISYTSSIAGTAWSFVSKYIPNIISATSTFISTIGKFIIGIIVALYFLIDRGRLYRGYKSIIAAYFNKKSYNKFIHVTEMSINKFTSFVTGKALDSLIIGIICFVAMSILRMDYVLLISVIVGLTNMIPFFGPFIGAIPSALILLLANPISAVEFLVLVIVLQQLDGNVIGPKILGDSVGVSSIGIIFAIILFGGYFGVAGMFIGVPIYAVIITLIEESVDEKLKLKGIDEEDL